MALLYVIGGSLWHACRLIVSSLMRQHSRLRRQPHESAAHGCRTIRIWDADGNAQVLEGHEGPVQCLLLLPDGSLLSGSNDKTVKIWQGTHCIRTLTGHNDTVRCRPISA
jgi:WD40 repeat protein